MYTNKQVRHANAADVYFDGFRVGALQNVSFDTDFGMQGQYEIGSIEPYENVPNQASYRMSAGYTVLIRDNLVKKGIVPVTGADVLDGNVFDIVTLDKDGSPLTKYVGCSIASTSVRISANQVIARDCTIMALRAVTGEV